MLCRCCGCWLRLLTWTCTPACLPALPALQVDNYSEAEEYHQRYLERGGRFGQPQSAAKRCDDPIRCYG